MNVFGSTSAFFVSTHNLYNALHISTAVQIDSAMVLTRSKLPRQPQNVLKLFKIVQNKIFRIVFILFHLLPGFPQF